MALKVRKDGAWVDIADNSANTTYTLPTFGTINGSSGLRLTGSDSTTDDVNITGTNGITVVGNSSNNTLTIDGGGAGSNTTYTLPLTGQTGGASVGSAKWTLDGSSGTDTSVTLNPGPNINISAIDISGNDRSFTLDATDTTYELKCTKDVDGGSTGTDSDPYLFLDASGTGTDDSVRVVGTGNVTVTRDNDGQLTINGSGSSGATTFTGLTDTPASYSGQGGKLVAVKTDLSGTQKLEFINNITYDLLGGGTDGGSGTFISGVGKIILRPSSGIDDEVSITAGDNIRIDGTSATGFTITADNSGGGGGTTYDYLLVDHGSSTGAGTGNDSILRLNETGTTNNDDIKLIAGSNVTFSPDTSAGTLTIAASGDTPSTTKMAILYDLKSQNVGGGSFTTGAWNVRTLNSKVDPESFVTFNSSATGINGTNTIFSLPAGKYHLQWRAPAWDAGMMRARLAYNVNSNFSGTTTYVMGETAQSDAVSEANTFAFGSATVTITSTTYFRIEHKPLQSGHFGLASNIADEIYTQCIIQDLASASGDSGITIKDEGNALSTLATTLNFVGSNVTATGTGAEKTITVSGGGGTTYDLLTADGDTTDSEKIRLTDGGSDIHDVILAVTGNLTIARNSSDNSITIDGSGAGSNTTYDLSALLSPGIKLTGSNGTTDSVFFDSDSTISITRTVAPGTDGGGTIKFSAATQAGTTYQLQGGGTNSSTFPGGTGTIKLNTGGATQDTVTVTAGDNIRIDTTGTSGFKIHADDVGSTAFKLKNSGGSAGNAAAIFELYPSGGAGTPDQKITITPGTGIEFTNTTQGLIIQAEAQSASTLNVSAPTNQSGPLLFVTGTGNNKTVYGDTALTWNASTDTLNIGANSSDKVAINADVSTQIYPSANESFDIGESPTNRWRKLYVKEVEADLILGSFSINTNDQEVLFTQESGGTKLVAGSSKFKFDESAGELQISNTGNNNFVHLTQDGGVEICRTNASTGGSGGAYVDFKDGTSDDYDSRIQLITSSANGNANANLPGGLQFICGVNKSKAVITTEGVFGISGSEEISNSTGGFCPSHPPNQPWGNSQPWVADVNGQLYVRRAGTSGDEGGHITLQDGDKGRGWSIDAYRGNNQSSGDRSRFRILSENSIANTGGRADQLFCMNRNGAVAWGGHKNNSNWPSGGDGHGNEDYGSSGAVLMSRGDDKPPIWSSTGGVSPEFSSPLKLARDNSTGEGGGILLAKSNSSSFVAGWEIDCNGTTSNPDYRVIDSSAGQVRFGVQGSSGAICVGQMGNWGQSGQVIMSQGSGYSSTYSHKPTSGAWWHSSKQTVPTIHIDGVMEIGKYLDFHATQTVANDYSARMENNAATPTAIIVRNYIQSYSDSRLKDNLVAISSPLDKVGIITGYTYNYTNTGEESPCRTGGVIAQDVEKVLPELIHDSSDGFKTLNYNGIAALLVEAVKELKAKNTALEARIAALESS